MKKCAYCGTKVPRKERRFYRAPCSIMDGAEPVCDGCTIRISPDFILEITGIIGVIGELS